MAIKIAGNRVLDYDVLSYSNTNIAVGYQTLQSLTTGTNNSAVGNSALYDLTTATNNTVIGYNTGRGITTGSKNTIIGANVTGLSATLANTIILADGDGNKRIYVDSSGNVGIGTSSPAEQLDLAGYAHLRAVTGNSYGYLSHQYISANSYDYWTLSSNFKRTGAAAGTINNSLLGTAAIDLMTAGGNVGTIAFSTGVNNTVPSEKMRIDSSGNVGIGTSTPSGARLQVYSLAGGTGAAINLQNLGSGDTALSINNSGGTNRFNVKLFSTETVTGLYGNNADVWIGSNTNGTIPTKAYVYFNNTTENVGIGTTSPQGKLDVSGISDAGSVYFRSTGRPFLDIKGGVNSYKSLRFSDGNDGTYRWDFNAFPGDHATNPHGFGIWSNAVGQIMSITSGGNFGIGTTSLPASKLTIYDSNKVIDSIGNFSVFTTNSQAADLGGSIGLGGANGSAGAFDPWAFAAIKGAKENSTSSNFAGYLAFATASSGGTIAERMRIDSSGKLLIGTTTASTNSLLTIVGGGIKIGNTNNTEATLHISTSYGGFDRLTQIHPTGASKPALNLMASNDASSNNQWWVWGIDANVWKIHSGTSFSATPTFSITSGGNVGIGTSSPGKKLDIISGSEAGLRIAASTTSGYAYIQLGQSATAANNWHFGSENDGSLRFYNGNWGSGTFRAYLNNLNNGTFHINDVAIGRGGGGLLDNMAVGYLALSSNTTNGAITALGPYALQYNTGYDNTAVGYVSLRNNTTGVQNTAVGAYSLNSNTTGNYNSAFGSYALAANTTGNLNDAHGLSALRLNTSGSTNSAYGHAAFYNNTTASNNVGIGFYAGLSNTTGYDNTIIGSQAFQNNTTGRSNVAVGRVALISNTTGVENNAVGALSLYYNTTGYSNSAMGYVALHNNTTGYANNAFGYGAMYVNTTGYYNTSMGHEALRGNTTGYGNSAFGFRALYSHTTGYYNTAVGYESLYYNTTGYQNSAFGFAALLSNTTGYNNTAVGYNNLRDVTTGIQNTAIGYDTGRGITTGSKNTIIGANVTGLSATLANNIIIADGDGTKRLQIDSNGEAFFTRTGGGGLTIISTYPTIAFQDTDNRSAFIHVNSNIFYVLRGTGTNVGQGNWAQTNSAWPLEINLETNNATFGGMIYAGGDNGRIATGYDSGSTYSISCSNWFRSNGSTGWFNATYSGGIYMTDSTYVRVYNSKSLQVDASGYFTVSLGIGTTPSGTAGEIRATNNITAYYSDQRLKENIRLITDPLEKVSKISGVTFTQNSLAETFGYKDYSQQVGVIAQEIQAVLPEAVTAAPFDIAADGTSKSGENYLTVRYEKLVPLLIEAIKELSAKVKELENK